MGAVKRVCRRPSGRAACASSTRRGFRHKPIGPSARKFFTQTAVHKHFCGRVPIFLATTLGDIDARFLLGEARSRTVNTVLFETNTNRQRLSAQSRGQKAGYTDNEVMGAIGGPSPQAVELTRSQ